MNREYAAWNYLPSNLHPIHIGPDVDVFDLENEPDAWCHSIECHTNEDMYLVKFYYGDGEEHNAWNYPYWIFGTGSCKKLTTDTQVRVEARVGGPYPGTVVAEKIINVIPGVPKCPCFDADTIKSAEDQRTRWPFSSGDTNSDDVSKKKFWMSNIGWYNSASYAVYRDTSSHTCSKPKMIAKGPIGYCFSGTTTISITPEQYQACEALLLERASAFFDRETEKAIAISDDATPCPCWDGVSYEASNSYEYCHITGGEALFYIQGVAVNHQTSASCKEGAIVQASGGPAETAACRLDVLTVCNKLMNNYFPGK